MTANWGPATCPSFVIPGTLLSYRAKRVYLRERNRHLVLTDDGLIGIGEQNGCLVLTEMSLMIAGGGEGEVLGREGGCIGRLTAKLLLLVRCLRPRPNVVKQWSLCRSRGTAPCTAPTLISSWHAYRPLIAYNVPGLSGNNGPGTFFCRLGTGWSQTRNIFPWTVRLEKVSFRRKSSNGVVQFGAKVRKFRT